MKTVDCKNLKKGDIIQAIHGTNKLKIANIREYMPPFCSPLRLDTHIPGGSPLAKTITFENDKGEKYTHNYTYYFKFKRLKKGTNEDSLHNR